MMVGEGTITIMYGIYLVLTVLHWTVVSGQNVTVEGNCGENIPYRAVRVWGRERDPLNCQLTKESCSFADLPPSVSGEFMGSPNKVSLDWNIVRVNTNMNPQLIIDWEPPRTASGFENLKGFSLEISAVASPKPFTPVCMVLDFSRSNFTSQDYKLKFQKKVIGLRGNGPDYLLQLLLYTLPRQQDSIPLYEFFTLPPLHYVNSPGNWSAGISYPTQTVPAPGDISFRFSLAPKEYHFEKYSMFLLSKADDQNFVVSCTMNVKSSYECQSKTFTPPSSDATYVDHTFYSIPPGMYKVGVQAYDIHWQSKDSCQCYFKDVTNDPICTKCITTYTGWITVEGTVPSTAAATEKTSGPIVDGGVTENPGKNDNSEEPDSSKTTDESKTGQSIQLPKNDNTLTVVAAVTGSVLGLFLVIVVGWLICRKRYTGHGYLFSNNKFSNRQGFPPEVPRKKVYMLFANDHKCHTAAVCKFSTYLEKHCNCSVMFPPWFQGPIRIMGSQRWIMSNIDAADYVIVICSEAAFNLNDGRNNNTPFKMEDEGPEGDMFSPALTHVMMKCNSPDFYKKTILAYFDYTPESFILKDISPGVQYQIPKHFKELLCHVHEVETFRQDQNQSKVNAMENIHSKADGRDLIEAITKVKIFQKQEPNWFNKRFVRQDSAYSSSPSSRSEDDENMQASISMRGSNPSLHLDHNGRYNGLERDVGYDGTESTYTYNTKGFNGGYEGLDHTVGYDGTESAYTYNTKYILSHPDTNDVPISMIAPSDLEIATVATSVINRQMADINKRYDGNTGGDSGYFQSDISQPAYHVDSNHKDYPSSSQYDSGNYSECSHHRNFSESSQTFPMGVYQGSLNKSAHPHVNVNQCDEPHAAGSGSDKTYVELEGWYGEDGRDV